MAATKPRKSQRFRYLPIIAVAFVVMLLGVGAVAYIRGIVSGGPPPTKKVAQEIHLIRPPPPPPRRPASSAPAS